MFLALGILMICNIIELTEIQGRKVQHNSGWVCVEHKNSCLARKRFLLLTIQSLDRSKVCVSDLLLLLLNTTFPAFNQLIRKCHEIPWFIAIRRDTW